MSFVRYNTEDSVISAETVVRGAWLSGSNTNAYELTTALTSSAIPTEYYVDVYATTFSTSASVQFSVQYGNINGSGSKVINTDVPNGGYTPSRVVYGEYRNLVYGTETQNFTFDGGVTTATDIFVISVARSQYKQALHPGTFNLKLTGNGNTINLTDDSNTTSLTRFAGENRIYYIISGSNGSPHTPSAATIYYGIMLPDLGTIILNASGSNSVQSYVAALATATSSAAIPTNAQRLVNSIRAGASFKLQSEEVVSSRYFFTRVKNSEFNYTTNPSIIDDNGNILYTTLIDNPQTYVTSVGLYNDNNELLAVAKLSKPLTKDFTKEALVRIKLDY
jgi:hypothetical protein